MLKKRLKTRSIAAIVVAALLLVNSAFAVLGAMGRISGSLSCGNSCTELIALNFVWGSLGIASSILLFKRYLLGLWGACLFFLFHTVGISTAEFIYRPRSGLSLFVSVGNDMSAISFNVLAIAAIVVLIAVFVRNRRLETSSRSGDEPR